MYLIAIFFFFWGNFVIPTKHIKTILFINFGLVDSLNNFLFIWRGFNPSIYCIFRKIRTFPVLNKKKLIVRLTQYTSPVNVKITVHLKLSSTTPYKYLLSNIFDIFYLEFIYFIKSLKEILCMLDIINNDTILDKNNLLFKRNQFIV